MDPAAEPAESLSNVSDPQPHTQAVRDRDESARWGVFAVAVMIHLVAFAGLSAFPPPPPPPPDPLDDLRAVLIADPTTLELSEPELPEPLPPEVEPEPVEVEPEPVPPDDAVVEPPVAPSSAPSTAEPEEPAPAGDPKPVAPAAPSGPSLPDEEEDKKSDGVTLPLGLTGLRGSSSAPPAPTSLRPRPGHWKNSGIGAKVAGDRRSDPIVGPSQQSDRKARSFAEAGFKARKDGTMVYKDKARRFKATLTPDGRIKFRNLVRNPAKAPGLSEAIRAGQGKEIYVQAKKKLLRETFDLRLAMGVQWAKQNMDAELKRLYRDLISLWHNKSRSAPQRRKALFARWDECEEDLSPSLAGDLAKKARSELDDARRAAGGKARRTIEGFIRKHLPSGSAEAFTVAELASFNRTRKSKQRFDPYGRS